MNNQTVLKQLENGYRMPRPQGNNIDCPAGYYNMMLECWRQDAEARPTFEHLKGTFEDFLVATQEQYKDAEGF
jgi:hypothetical protein